MKRTRLGPWAIRGRGSLQTFRLLWWGFLDPCVGKMQGV